ncbi:MAG: peptidylprolyl isomerase [Chitinophagaceae bacterium]
MKKLFFVLLAMIFVSASQAQKPIKNKYVEIETTMGTIVVEVYADVTQHAENFLKLASEGYYDSVLFHRVIPNFMIQGGDPDSKHAEPNKMLGNGDIGYRVPKEFMVPKYFHRKGALAAARDNNPDQASSGCQFYIVVGKTVSDADIDNLEKNLNVTFSKEDRALYKAQGGTPHLDGAYTVFGQVVQGQDVVDAISLVARNAANRPNEDIRILSTKVKKKFKKKKP